jgi:hypothetical protein
MTERARLVVSWGGGVNSTALLIGLQERSIRPDVITFADTGGEKPETYQYRTTFDRWLGDHDLPAITTVANDGMYVTLENNCRTKKMLPSLAYGFKSCSEKYKKRPQEKYLKGRKWAKRVWAAGGKIRKAIGIDAGEAHRAKVSEDRCYTYWYPLIEWNWAREECIAAIIRAGLPVPIKSACFFCPASTKREVVWLAEHHPELMQRALDMEEIARPGLGTVRGLGRRWSWQEFLTTEHPERLPNPPAQDCMCFDGEEDE